MAGSTFTLIEAIERQADSCAHIGSPLYAGLLTGLAGDYLSGGLTAELLEGVSDQPVHDAVPLRYLATAHRLALAGNAPDLAALYPSCGGSWHGGDLTDVFLSAVAVHRGEFVRGLQRNVQTNEVGRAAVLAAGFSTIADRTGLPLRTLELGGSAGLLSHWDRFGFSTGESSTGDPGSPLQFGPEWYERPAPHLHAAIRVVERASVDVTPIDVSTDEGRLSMLSFVWPDQLERFQRLDHAIAIARATDLTVAEADAGDWLGEQLTRPSDDGVATVVFHSIVWQYLPAATKDAVRSALSAAGERATGSAPLHWLRMEPATKEHADLRLTTWAGERDPVEQLLAHVGYHGAGVRWVG
ncbi:MAG: DUF2332 domain-containing protein [Actinobacteria bacterium]|nr:DUF2332 domain-containing protein [Actinomycetota bacterium]